MKYWNKTKEVRLRCWTKISKGPANDQIEVWKVWCQHHPSKGKFWYRHSEWYEDYSNPNMIEKGYTDCVWYFENAQDALAFKLVWCK